MAALENKVELLFESQWQDTKVMAKAVKAAIEGKPTVELEKPKQQ